MHFSEYLLLKSRQSMEKSLANQCRLDLSLLLHSCQVNSLLQVSSGDFISVCLMFEWAKVDGWSQRLYEQWSGRWQMCILKWWRHFKGCRVFLFNSGTFTVLVFQALSDKVVCELVGPICCTFVRGSHSGLDPSDRSCHPPWSCSRSCIK